MLRVRLCEDPEEAQRLWQSHWPYTRLFDLWPVRACFQAEFNNRPYFVAAEEDGEIRGLLALSWIEEEQYFGHFPGETWQGKTWLEQNKILARDPKVFQALLGHVPGPARIRYLMRECLFPDEGSLVIDEVGYLFFPRRYGYSFHAYMEEFSGKSRKKIGRELANLEALGLHYRHDCMEDVKHLFRLNQEAFGERSYFNDCRFLKSFENLLAWLNEKRLLRVTTVVLKGKVAAVDAGALLDHCYTVLAGGTHPDFPGVAKLINFHHLEWACHQRLEEVDFLCGDFGWKERFHLTPRPLYEIQLLPAKAVQQQSLHESSIAFYE